MNNGGKDQAGIVTWEEDQNLGGLEKESESKGLYRTFDPAITDSNQETNGLTSMKGIAPKKKIKKAIEVSNKSIFTRLVELNLEEFQSKGNRMGVTVEKVERPTKVGFLLEGSTKQDVAHFFQYISQRIELLEHLSHDQKGGHEVGVTASPGEGNNAGLNTTEKYESSETSVSTEQSGDVVRSITQSNKVLEQYLQSQTGSGDTFGSRASTEEGKVARLSITETNENDKLSGSTKEDGDIQSRNQSSKVQEQQLQAQTCSGDTIGSPASREAGKDARPSTTESSEKSGSTKENGDGVQSTSQSSEVQEQQLQSQTGSRYTVSAPASTEAGKDARVSIIEKNESSEISGFTKDKSSKVQDQQFQGKSSSGVTVTEGKGVKPSSTETNESNTISEKSCELNLLIKYVKSRGMDGKDDTFLHDVQCSFHFLAQWNYYNKTDCGRKLLEAILDKHHCRVSLPKDTLFEGTFLFQIFEQTFHKSSGVKQFVQVVLDAVHQNAEKELSIKTFTVDSRLHNDVLETVRQTKELDCVWIEFGGEQGQEICMVCQLEHKMIVTQRFSDIVKATEECFKNHEETVGVDFMWHRVMIKFGYLEKVNNKFPKIIINWDEANNVLVLKGPRDEARNAAGTVLEILGTAQHEISVVMFSPHCQLEIFTHPEMCAYINRVIPQVDVVWLLNHLSKKIHLFAKDPKQLHGIDKAIKGCVQEKFYPISKDSSKRLATQETNRWLEELMKQYTGRLLIQSSTACLLVTTADDIYENVDATIQKILGREEGVDQKVQEAEEQDERNRSPSAEAEESIDEQRDWFYPNGKKITLVNSFSCNPNVIITPGKSDKDGQPQFSVKEIMDLKVPTFKEGIAKSELSEAVKQTLKKISEKRVGIYIKAANGWKFNLYLKCFLFQIEQFLMKSDAEPCPVECVILIVKDASDYNNAIQIIDSFKSRDKPQELDPVFKRIKVRIHKGLLHSAQVEVLVNSVDKTLDLKSGKISSSLLKNAGDRIQKELSRVRKIEFGGVIKTGKGNLPKPCMAILHGVLHPYRRHSESEKAFHDFIQSCLVEANKEYKSIAFPPIGTGNLYYPKDFVASMMFQCVAEFEVNHPMSKLEEVIFVIYEKDEETLKIFEDLHKRCIGMDIPTLVI